MMHVVLSLPIRFLFTKHDLLVMCVRSKWSGADAKLKDMIAIFIFGWTVASCIGRVGWVAVGCRSVRSLVKCRTMHDDLVWVFDEWSCLLLPQNVS